MYIYVYILCIYNYVSGGIYDPGDIHIQYLHSGDIRDPSLASTQVAYMRSVSPVAGMKLSSLLLLLLSLALSLLLLSLLLSLVLVLLYVLCSFVFLCLLFMMCQSLLFISCIISFCRHEAELRRRMKPSLQDSRVPQA